MAYKKLNRTQAAARTAVRRILWRARRAAQLVNLATRNRDTLAYLQSSSREYAFREAALMIAEAAEIGYYSRAVYRSPNGSIRELRSSRRIA